MEKFVKNFDKIMDCLKIVQVVVSNINTDAKIKTRITSVNDFKVAELEMMNV